MENQKENKPIGDEQQIKILGATLNESLELTKVIQMTVDAACALIPAAQRAVFHLFDEKDEVLKPISVSGTIDHQAPSLSMRLGEGVAGSVLLAGQLSNVADVRQDARFAPTSPAQQVPLSLLVAPVQRSNRKYGTISVQSQHANAFTNKDENLLMEFAQYASIAIENAWLYEQANVHRRWAEALLDATAMMTRSLDPDIVLDAILDQVAQVAPARSQYIMLIKEEKVSIVRYRDKNGIAEQLPQKSFIQSSVNANPFSHVINCRQPFVESLVQNAPNWIAAADREYVRSYAVLPLQTDEQVSGFLIVLSDQQNAFDENLLFHLRIFADHASIALYNAQLHAKLKKALDHETEMRNHMLQQEHLAAMGRMVSLVAHALNNPLQALINSIYLVGQEIPSDSAAHEFLKFAQKDIHRLSNLIAQLREVYRPSTSDKKTTLSLKKLLQETYHLIEAQLPPQHIQWEVLEFPEDVMIEGVQSQIIQCFLNICLNAIESMKDASQGRICIQCTPHPTEPFIGISFQDTGKGIPEDDLPKVFDPYYSTKSTKIGLGLTVCNEIVRQHNGKIEIHSTVGRGTTITVWFPYNHSFQTSSEGG